MQEDAAISQAKQFWNQRMPARAMQVLIERICALGAPPEDTAIVEATKLWEQRKQREAMLILVKRVNELTGETSHPIQNDNLEPSRHLENQTLAIQRIQMSKRNLLNSLLTMLTICLAVCLLYLIARVDKLQNKLNSAQANITVLNEDFDGLQSKVTSLSEGVKAVQDDIDVLSKDVSNAKSDVYTLTQGFNDTQSDIRVLASAVDTLDSDMSTAFSNIRTLASGLDYVTPLAENANNYAHSHNSWSDARLKTDVRDASSVLENVLRLRIVEYKWDSANNPDLLLDGDMHVGLIAQEVEELFPELVVTDTNGYKSLDYAKLTPILIKAIQEQQLMITQQQTCDS